MKFIDKLQSFYCGSLQWEGLIEVLLWYLLQPRTALWKWWESQSKVFECSRTVETCYKALWSCRQLQDQWSFCVKFITTSLLELSYVFLLFNATSKRMDTPAPSVKHLTNINYLLSALPLYQWQDMCFSSPIKAPPRICWTCALSEWSPLLCYLCSSNEKASLLSELEQRKKKKLTRSGLQCIRILWERIAPLPWDGLIWFVDISFPSLCYRMLQSPVRWRRMGEPELITCFN